MIVEGKSPLTTGLFDILMAVQVVVLLLPLVVIIERGGILDSETGAGAIRISLWTRAL